MKFVRVSSSCVSDNVIMNDVCFESLVLPDNDEQSPKLRFAGLKVKTKKVK